VKLQNSAAIDAYVGALKPGDTVLLGTIVDGGQGLATGNNGRYLGVLRTSKFADKIQVQRREKLIQALLSKKDNRLGDTEESIGRNFDSLSEDQVFDLMENIKEQYGRDVFGKGFIYRIVYPESIHSVSDMSDSDKKDGLTSSNAFVPYDKGDRDGNSWVLPTPFYIEWSKDKVSELKQSSGKKHSGAAVIRNPQFYFLPGVCWILTLNESSEYLKARLREPGVFDVNAMSIFLENDLITEKFLVCLLNSYFVFKYQKTFINSTSAFQINDARQLPIVIPNDVQLRRFEEIFDRAEALKLQQYANPANTNEADAKLALLQQDLDQSILELYGVEDSPEFQPKQ
jgi:hypothetical protein